VQGLLYLIFSYLARFVQRSHSATSFYKENATYLIIKIQIAKQQAS